MSYSPFSQFKKYNQKILVHELNRPCTYNKYLQSGLKLPNSALWYSEIPKLVGVLSLFLFFKSTATKQSKQAAALRRRSTRRRALTYARSSGVGLFASSGDDGIRKKNARPTTQVRTPSRMKIQRQPEYPLNPSIFPIALARRPANALASVVLLKKKEFRR